MRIGGTEIKRGLILAPMAGYTDSAMRTVCRELGAEYSVTEMVSAKAVLFSDRKTRSIARISGSEGPVAIQIFGTDADIMARAAEILVRESCEDGGVPPVAIDINMGCPMRKIYGNGEGSALMKNPDEIYRIVKAVSGAVSLPVTVKIRSGIDERSINAVDCALAAQAGGAAAVAVHGRTREQMYGGSSDSGIIRAVKSAVSIPVIASGDICSRESLGRIITETGADGFMIGRAAVGCPFIFADLAAYIDGREYFYPSLDEKKRVALRQLSLAKEDKGEAVAVSETKKQIASYFKGYRGSAELRMKIHSALTCREIEAYLSDFDCEEV